MQNPRVAVIGAGRWGRNIIRALAIDPSTIAYIAHSWSAETKAFLADTYPTIPTTTDYREALHDNSVDAVIIATPIETHCAIVRDALHSDKHVLCEKPLTTNLAEVAELYALAEKKGLVLMTGYLYRFDAAYVALVERAANASEVSLDFTWEKYGTFDSPLHENLLVHELSLMLSVFETVHLNVVTKDEPDVFDATFQGDRGTARVRIDRTKQERIKKVTAVIDGEIITHDFTQHNLLDIELQAFLSEIENETADSEKRQHIDESIAAILTALHS